MGFLNASCQVLLHARKRLGVDFSRTITLGRQELFMKPTDLREMARTQGIGTAEQLQRLDLSEGYSERLFELLGSERVESMDASDYEKATIIHDLNLPVPSSLHGRFTCVVDGGTIEHVFHFPNAIKSCMDMLAVGGHYIGLTPANNQMGHGFYQFSPELYYRVFSAENGFEVRTMLVRSASDWYEVADPKTMHERTELVNAVPVTLVVIARKNKVVDVLRTPQQSDYVSAWKAQDANLSANDPDRPSTARRIARRILPRRVKTLIRRITALTKDTDKVEGLGTIDTRHFKRVEL